MSGLRGGDKILRRSIAGRAETLHASRVRWGRTMRAVVGSAFLLAALLAGCTNSQQSGLNAFAMVTPEQVRHADADASFRLNQLRLGLTKAELEALYPNRMVLVADDSDERTSFYFVEPLDVTTGTAVPRNRLVLQVVEGRLAGFDVLHSDDVVMGATEIAGLPASAPMTPPAGRYGVQIAARNSEAEARAYIDEMRARYPNLLAQRWATIQRATVARGQVYRVVIGPLPTAEEAQQLCQSLRAQGAECFPRNS
jgi:hypothetical protein